MRPAVFLDRDGVINRALVRNNKPFPPMRSTRSRCCRACRRRCAASCGGLRADRGDEPAGCRPREADERGRAGHPRSPRHAGRRRRVSGLLPRRCRWMRCRKPKPGLLTAAPAHALDRSIIVGDRWRDIEAGRRAGCRATVFVDYGYDEPTPVDAGHARAIAGRSRRLDFEAGERDVNLSDSSNEDLRRRRGARWHARAVSPAVHQGVHHQPDAHAEGRHHRLPRVCQAGGRRHSGSPDLVRGVLGRVRGDGAPGARDRHVGRARLREDPRHEHQTRARLRSDPAPVAPRASS